MDHQDTSGLHGADHLNQRKHNDYPGRPLLGAGLFLLFSFFIPQNFSSHHIASHASEQKAPPPATDKKRAQYRTQLFTALQTAPDEITARQIENQIWQFWLSAQKGIIRQHMSDALAARRSYDYDKALSLLNTITKQAPEYAEGWNQRATVLFLKGKYDASLDDIERVLALEPFHFGALSGRAQILIRQGRFALGQKSLRAAVKINPWLRERSMLVPPLAPPVKNKGERSL